MELHGDLLAQAPGEPLGEGSGLARLGGVTPVETQWQPHQHELRLALAGQRPQPRQAPACSRLGDGLQGVTIVPVGSLIAQPHRALP